MRKRHTQTLILAIRYFYRFLGILTEFSVREHAGPLQAVRSAATVAAPSTGILAARSTRAASVRLLPVVTRSSTSTTAPAEIGRPQPESASQVLLAGRCAQTGLIGDGPCLDECRSNRHRVPQPEATRGEAGHRGGRIESPLTDGSRLLKGSAPRRCC